MHRKARYIFGAPTNFVSEWGERRYELLSMIEQSDIIRAISLPNAMSRSRKAIGQYRTGQVRPPCTSTHFFYVIVWQYGSEWYKKTTALGVTSCRLFADKDDIYTIYIRQIYDNDRYTLDIRYITITIQVITNYQSPITNHQLP